MQLTCGAKHQSSLLTVSVRYAKTCIWSIQQTLSFAQWKYRHQITHCWELPPWSTNDWLYFGRNVTLNSKTLERGSKIRLVHFHFLKKTVEGYWSHRMPCIAYIIFNRLFFSAYHCYSHSFLGSTATKKLLVVQIRLALLKTLTKLIWPILH